MQKQKLDWKATEDRAKRMSREALEWSIKDCSAAAEMAEALERTGNPVMKDGGYYRDEASVYHRVLLSRETAASRFEEEMLERLAHGVSADHVAALARWVSKRFEQLFCEEMHKRRPEPRQTRCEAYVVTDPTMSQEMFGWR